MTPAAGMLCVRPIDAAETRPGGHVVLLAETRERMTANQCEVLAVGALRMCEDEDCERVHDALAQGPLSIANIVGRIHRCPVRVGDWLLVRPRCYIAGPAPERAEWFIAQDDVLAILHED